MPFKEKKTNACPGRECRSKKRKQMLARGESAVQRKENKRRALLQEWLRNSRKAEMVLLLLSFCFLVSKEKEWFVSSETQKNPKKDGVFQNHSVALLASSFEEEQEEPFFKNRSVVLLFASHSKNPKKRTQRTASFQARRRRRPGLVSEDQVCFKKTRGRRRPETWCCSTTLLVVSC